MKSKLHPLIILLPTQVIYPFPHRSYRTFSSKLTESRPHPLSIDISVCTSPFHSPSHFSSSFFPTVLIAAPFFLASATTTITSRSLTLGAEALTGR